MENNAPPRDQADLVEHPSRAAPSPNPFAQSANVMISVPETVEVRLVDASVLGDYEIWFFVASLLASAVVGFLVAFLQAEPAAANQLLATSLMFGALFLIAGGMTLYKRGKLHTRVKRLRFKVGEQLPAASGEGG